MSSLHETQRVLYGISQSWPFSGLQGMTLGYIGKMYKEFSKIVLNMLNIGIVKYDSFSEIEILYS
jgi:hypothetical protein